MWPSFALSAWTAVPVRLRLRGLSSRAFRGAPNVSFSFVRSSNVRPWFPPFIGHPHVQLKSFCTALNEPRLAHPHQKCSLFVLMPEVETLGQAFSAKWGIRLRCGRGARRGIVKIDECRYSVQLDVETLVCTRGRAFPLSQLATRMMCPNCGERRVFLTFDVPGSYEPAFIPQVHRR